MDRRELAATIILLVIVVGLPVAALGYHFHLFPDRSGARTIDIIAAAPERGGFQPDVIRVAAGEKVRLRFSVPDVTHGIALGPGLGIDLGQIDPGQVEEIKLAFAEPGRYAYYCNTWCSPNHWRMRGVIEVYDPANPGRLVSDNRPDPVTGALAEQGIDIDAPHPASVIPAAVKPSATRGEALSTRMEAPLPPEFDDAGWRRGQSPAEAHALLSRELPAVSEVEAWDIIAFHWLRDLTPERREWATEQYAKNCAACHGEAGTGTGPGVDALRQQGLGRHGQEDLSAAFNDPQTMLGGTSNIYYAKIRRGGMGTGMPDFGPVITEDETWMLANYLWTFQFDE